MSTYPMNQFSPLAKQGVMQPPPTQVGWEDKHAAYPFSPPNGQLTANQDLTDSVAINVDADFWCAAFYISQFTGPFQFSITDATGYQITEGLINANGVAQSASEPTVISPAHPFPAGGKIQLRLMDLSGADNPLQIVFVGWKRFRVQRQQPMQMAYPGV